MLVPSAALLVPSYAPPLRHLYHGALTALQVLWRPEATTAQATLRSPSVRGAAMPACELGAATVEVPLVWPRRNGADRAVAAALRLLRRHPCTYERWLRLLMQDNIAHQSIPANSMLALVMAILLRWRMSRSLPR